MGEVEAGGREEVVVEVGLGGGGRRRSRGGVE